MIATIGDIENERRPAPQRLVFIKLDDPATKPLSSISIGLEFRLVKLIFKKLACTLRALNGLAP